MSELSKQALKVENNQSFPNNNAGLITPSALRTFNENVIDSMVDEISYNVDSGSWNQKIDTLSSITGSIPLSGSYATTGSNTFRGTQTIIDTTGLQIKSDVSETEFITIKSGTNILGLGRIEGVQVYNFGKSYLRLADAGTSEAASLTGLYTSYQDGKVAIGVAPIDSGLTTPTQLQVYKNKINLNVASTLLSGSLTASLQEGYVWVGDSSGKTIATSTGSFGSVLPSGVVSGSSQIILQDTTGNLSGSRIDGLVLSSSYAISSSHSELADLATLATNATYAQNTITTGKNLHNTTIAKGTPLFFTGSGTSGNLVGVYPADAGNPDRMPAGGIAGESFAVGAEGIVLLDGYIEGVDTSLFASGDEVFVAVGGGYTNVAPTGSALIQHLGNVEKSAVNGSGVIQMMGEVRGLPNLQQGYAWVGDSNGVPQPIPTSSFGGGGSIDTGSFATTGSNIFVGDETVIGDVIISGSNHLFIQRSPTGAQQYLRLGPTDNQNNFAFIVTGSDENPGQQVWGINVAGGQWQNGFDAPTGFSSTATFLSGLSIRFGGGLPTSRMGVNHISESVEVYTGLSTHGTYIVSSSVDERILEVNPTTATVAISNTISSQIFLNPQVLTGTQSVPSGFNGMITGPVSNAGTIVVESGSTLVII